MIAQIRPALVILILMTALTGILYPMAIEGLAQTVFPHQANGSLVYRNGKIVGSELIGQNFSSSKYFHGRPSAAGNGYDAGNSGASNYGPTSKALVKRVAVDAAKLHAENPDQPVPVDLVTTSASGLDPDITPAAALFQVPRVAKARNLSAETVRQLVEAHTQGRWLGVLGESRVNVLELNMALDAMRQPGG